jgi:hypothetical protein
MKAKNLIEMIEKFFYGRYESTYIINIATKEKKAVVDMTIGEALNFDVGAVKQISIDPDLNDEDKETYYIGI